MKVYVVVTETRYDRNLGVFATHALAVEHQRANASGWDDDDGALSVEQWRDAYAWHHSVIEEY